MQITIKVWGDFDRDSKTPLLAEDRAYVADYAEARERGQMALRLHEGKNAHVQCSGPNQNANSIWIAR